MGFQIKTPKTLRMQFNRLTLAFTGKQNRLEPAFHDHYFNSTLNQIRVALLTGLICYGAFGALDAVFIGNRYLSFWIIRWAIICPLLFLVILFSYTSHAYRYLQPMVSFVTLCGGFGIIAMIQLAAQNSNNVYESGLVQIIFFIFTFLRLRFIWGTITAVTLVVTYLATSFTLGNMPNKYLLAHGSHLSLICLMGMMTGYAIEYGSRRNFFLSRQLEAKKRRLARANKFLEQRVAKRTAEQRKTNELLKEEINGRKMIESALRESQMRYQRMVDNVTDYMCVYDLNGRILEANRQMCKGLGYGFDELLKIGYPNLIHADEHLTFFQYIKEIRRSGTAVGTMTLLTRAGEKRFFEYSNVLAEHATGHQAIFSLARDITHRKKTEKALADSQLRFQIIFETAAAGMAIVERKTLQVVEINSAAAQMLEKSAEQAKGQHLYTLISMPEDAADHHLPVPTQHAIECLLNTGQDRFLPILASTRETVFEEMPHWIISFVNIEKIKEAEAAKRDLEIRSNRMQHNESIGTLAGGIAHDFNNILFGVMGFAELALEDAAKESVQASNLKEILRGGNRAKEMISQILAFSRQDCIEKRVIQPAPLVKEALKLLRASLPTTIDIVSHFASNVFKIKANPVHIHQVAMNLCTNAAHSLGDEIGRIEVEVGNTILTSDEVTSHGVIAKGEYFRLMVKDNGRGMPDEVIDRIFEPYFTTKSQGQGSGMGLSVVLGIVQALDGNIRVESRLGIGTCFEIFIPATQSIAQEDKTSETEMPRGGEHIMVIDDERALLIMLERMLKGLGYNVTKCHHPTKAMSQFKSAPHVYDLVITDLTMPAMTGVQIAREFLQIRPDLPIMIITGNNERLSEEKLQSIGIRDLLIKPVFKKELAAAIRRAVESN